MPSLLPHVASKHVSVYTTQRLARVTDEIKISIQNPASLSHIHILYIHYVTYYKRCFISERPRIGYNTRKHTPPTINIQVFIK